MMLGFSITMILLLRVVLSLSLRRDFTQTFAPLTCLLSSNESYFPHWLLCLFSAGDTSLTLKMPLKKWSCECHQYIKISSFIAVVYIFLNKHLHFRSTIKPGVPPPLPPKVRPKMIYMLFWFNVWVFADDFTLSLSPHPPSAEIKQLIWGAWP